MGIGIRLRDSQGRNSGLNKRPASNADPYKITKLLSEVLVESTVNSVVL